MKIERGKAYEPITIKLETLEDALAFKIIINGFIQTNLSARLMQDELSLWFENVVK